MLKTAKKWCFAEPEIHSEDNSGDDVSKQTDSEEIDGLDFLTEKEKCMKRNLVWSVVTVEKGNLLAQDSQLSHSLLRIMIQCNILCCIMLIW